MAFPEQQEFVTRLKNGHESSFTVLYETYGSKIYQLAFRMLGNQQEAEDITQETFLQVFRHIDSFQEASQLYTWIYTIAKNLCYRACQHQKKVSFASLDTLIHTVKDQEIPAEITKLQRYHLIHQVKEGCLTGLVRCLSFYQRIAFILHVLLHLPMKEIALILDKSEGAVKVLVYRARQHLKAFLCKNCSLYHSDNSCRCENLAGFSLKQGWITLPSEKESAAFTPVTLQKIEDELERFRKMTELYKTLPGQNPPDKVRSRIQHVLGSQDWIILSDKKV